MKINELDILMPVELNGIKFRNPFFVSSGPTTKSIDLLVKAEEYGWGAASIKLTFDPYPYINKKPRYGWKKELKYFFFTAEKRLSLEEGLKLIEAGRKKTKELILWANMTYSGDKGIEGWVNMARKFEEAGAHIIELNMCCPNMSFNLEVSGDKDKNGPKTGASLGQDLKAVSLIVKAIKEMVSIPVFVKLTGEGGRIGEVARAAVEAGANGVGSAANRLAIPPINIYNPKKSICYLQKQHTMACYGGSWLKPSGLRDTFEMRKFVGPNSTVLGVGGIENYHDVVESVMAGADLIGICTEILVSGFECLVPIMKDLKKYMKEMGYKSLSDFRDLLIENTASAEELVIYEGQANIKSPVIAPCKFTCPNSIPAQTYVRMVAEGDFKQAFQILTSSSPLQTICSYVCPHPCETECTRNELDEPIAIKEIKKFLLEYGRAKKWQPEIKVSNPNEIKIAIVGGGPAGFSCAFYLAKAGYKVTIFEKENEVGGIPYLTIPKFRLPEEIIIYERKMLTYLNIKVETGVLFGKDIKLKDLQKNFKAIFLAVGTHEDIKLNIPGKSAEGVYASLKFLKLIKQGAKLEIGERVAIIGGGFSAIDSARTVIRLGAKEVFILYRRTKEEMPASLEEIMYAEEEGVKIMYLVAPKEVIVKNNKVVAIKMINLILGEKDTSLRRKPMEVEGTEFTLKIDTLISAIGQEQDEEFKKLQLEYNEITGATNIPGVYIGGDCATGAKDIISAIYGGKLAATSIDIFLAGENATLKYPFSDSVNKEKVLKEKGSFLKSKRIKSKILPSEERKANFYDHAFILNEEEAVLEAKRCLNCGCDLACGICAKICTSFAIDYTEQGFKIKEDKCEACGMCVQVCLNENIEMIEKM